MFYYYKTDKVVAAEDSTWHVPEHKFGKFKNILMPSFPRIYDAICCIPPPPLIDPSTKALHWTHRGPNPYTPLLVFIVSKLE